MKLQNDQNQTELDIKEMESEMQKYGFNENHTFIYRQKDNLTHIEGIQNVSDVN